jgi:hypothetical protein
VARQNIVNPAPVVEEPARVLIFPEPEPQEQFPVAVPDPAPRGPSDESLRIALLICREKQDHYGRARCLHRNTSLALTGAAITGLFVPQLAIPDDVRNVLTAGMLLLSICFLHIDVHMVRAHRLYTHMAVELEQELHLAVFSTVAREKCNTVSRFFSETSWTYAIYGLMIGVWTYLLLRAVAV